MRPNYTSIFFILVCFIVLQSVSAQGLTLLGSGGGYASSGDLHLSYSIGEPLIQYAQNNSQWLTEGFQQPGHMDLMVSTDRYDEISNITVHPNPASYTITLTGDDLSECISISLFNLLGQSVLRTDITDGLSQTITIDALQPGLYMLTLQCHDKQYRSQSIIKL